MVAISGTYKDGYVKLDKEFNSHSPVKVIVTFLEDIVREPEKILVLSDFSFAKSQKNLEENKGSFSDVLTEERRNEPVIIK